MGRILFKQEESFLLSLEPYGLALSAEKHVSTHVHVCVFHILARNAKS